MARMTEQEIVEKFSPAINDAVENWLWTREDAITDLQDLSEIEKTDDEIVYQFRWMVENENEVIARGYGRSYREIEDEVSPAEWMEPGVAYTMGDEGWESWANPYNNY